MLAIAIAVNYLDRQDLPVVISEVEKAVALDAATGARIWSFDPAVHNHGTVIRLRNRGVTYWKGSEGERIFDFVGDRV